MDLTVARHGTARPLWGFAFIASLALAAAACAPPLAPPPKPAPPPPSGPCATAVATTPLAAPTSTPAALTSTQAANSATKATADADPGAVTLVTAERADDGSLDIDSHQTTKHQAPAVAAAAAADGDLLAVDVPHEVSSLATATDPRRNEQWALDDVDFESVWPHIGTGVTVAVVDSGVSNHQDLAGRLLSGAQFLNNIGVSCGDGRTDGYGHGTHVAGIIAANANNGVGIAGAAPGVSILPVRVLGTNGSGWDTDVARGVTWATDHGAKVINLSLGSSVASPVLKTAVDYAVNHGVTVVAAGGNEHQPSGGDLPSYPGGFSNVIAVAAVDSARNVASFSTRGSYVDVAAPGVYVLSTYPVPANSYKVMSGTSMATPYVAAAAALVVQEFPTWTPAHVQTCLESTAWHLGAGGKNTATGSGLINPVAASSCT